MAALDLAGKGFVAKGSTHHKVDEKHVYRNPMDFSFFFNPMTGKVVSGPWNYRAACQTKSLWTPWPWRTTTEPDWVSQDEIPPGLRAFLRGDDRFEKKKDQPDQPDQPLSVICLEKAKQTPAYTFQQFFDYLRDGHDDLQLSLPANADLWFDALDRHREGRVGNTGFLTSMRENGHLAPKPLDWFSNR